MYWAKLNLLSRAGALARQTQRGRRRCLRSSEISPPGAGEKLDPIMNFSPS
jgi:hypothetical protein